MKIGSVIHYYDKLGVAIIRLDESLKVGDKIKFTRGGEDLFEQEVVSLQMDHNNISEAKKGDEVGLKVDNEVKEGAEVQKIK